MISFNLDPDEGIVLESDNVSWVSEERATLEQMALTNKSICLAYRKRANSPFGDLNPFKQPPLETLKMPLSDIKVFNDRLMADCVKNNHGHCLQIQFVQGTELFLFGSQSKKQAIAWVEALYQLVLRTQPPAQEQDSLSAKAEAREKRGNAFSNIGKGLGGLAADMKGAASSFKQAASDTTRRTNDSTGFSHATPAPQAQAYAQPATPSPTSSRFCMNCGAALVPGMKFCGGCGTPVGAVPQATSPTPVAFPQNPETRHQEFAGIIVKCPSCGASVGQSTAVCPECGHRLTGQAAVSSVQAFNNQLMALESQRKRPSTLQSLNPFQASNMADPVDSQKLSLIRSFPIPNTIDDIQEFAFLAATSINIGLSKNNFFNRLGSGSESFASTIDKAISDAWVSKLQQTYQKAKLMFPNEPEFVYLKQLYVEKMTQLNIDVDD